MGKQQIGVVGLAVMGKNLAMNMESKGFSVAVYNRSSEKTDELLAEAAGKNFVGAYSVEEFVQSLELPRKIMIMVKAGKPTDDTIQQLIPFLSPGDILIDGGNAFSRTHSAVTRSCRPRASALSAQVYRAVKRAH